jgi:hypothetical protein
MFDWKKIIVPGYLNPYVRVFYILLFLIISIGQIYCSILEENLMPF